MSHLDLKEQTHDALAKLHTIADEIRLRIHLAAMELKEKWKDFEFQLNKLELAAQKTSREVLQSLHELLAQFEELGARVMEPEIKTNGA